MSKVNVIRDDTVLTKKVYAVSFQALRKVPFHFRNGHTEFCGESCYEKDGQEGSYEDAVTLLQWRYRREHKIGEMVNTVTNRYCSFVL